MKKKALLILLRLAVVAIGIGFGLRWFLKGDNRQEITQAFGQLNLWILMLALGVFVISQVLVAFRWWLLLRSQKIYITLSAAIKLHYLGLFYNNFMPSSVGGDLVRAWYVGKHTDRKYQAALSVFVDRAIGLFSTFLIAIFFYLTFLKGQNLQSQNTSDTNAVGCPVNVRQCLLAVAILIAIFMACLAIKPLRRLMIKLREKFSHLWHKSAEAFKLYCQSPATVLAVLAITIFGQIMVITGFWFVGQNLGITVSIKYYYVFFTLTWVLGAVPVSIGGIGLVEGSLATLFITVAGVAAPLAGALVICQRLVWMIASLPGAVIHLAAAHLPKNNTEIK